MGGFGSSGGGGGVKKRKTRSRQKNFKKDKRSEEVKLAKFGTLELPTTLDSKNDRDKCYNCNKFGHWGKDCPLADRRDNQVEAEEEGEAEDVPTENVNSKVTFDKEVEDEDVDESPKDCEPAWVKQLGVPEETKGKEEASDDGEETGLSVEKAEEEESKPSKKTKKKKKPKF